MEMSSPCSLTDSACDYLHVCHSLIIDRSVGFSMLMFTRVYAKLSQLAAQRGQHEVKKWFVVDQTMFQTAPRVIHRTELEHELAEFWTRLSQLAMQIGIVMFLHLYIGSAEAVLIQGAMNVRFSVSVSLAGLSSWLPAFSERFYFRAICR